MTPAETYIRCAKLARAMRRRTVPSHRPGRVLMAAQARRRDPQLLAGAMIDAMIVGAKR